MSKTVDAKELAYEIGEYLSYKLKLEFDTRIQILNQAYKFNSQESDEKIVERAERFAKFVFSKEAMVSIYEEIHETLKNRGISLTNDDPAMS